MKRIFPSRGLYFVTSQEYLQDRSTADVARDAVLGGISILQMREKHMDHADLLQLGKRLRNLCSEHNVTFIVNDNPTLAVELDADGVHLGQEDAAAIGIAEARKVMGPDRIIGLSTHSLEQVHAANELDVDYIGYGPLFHTKTKDYYIGTDELTQALSVATMPVTCIGGVTPENIQTVLTAGGQVVAAIRAIACADKVTERVQEFMGSMHEYRINKK